MHVSIISVAIPIQIQSSGQDWTVLTKRSRKKRGVKCTIQS